MRVVLFGAGASYGSGSVAPKPPPLGADLFPALRKLFPTWRSIPEAEAALFAADFEEGMAQIIERYGMAVGPLMQEVATFFSIFDLDATAQNLYRDLITAARGRDVLWSTVNYECLLEIAANQTGLDVAYFGDPADHSSGAIWKLHGSCNFKVTGLEAGRGVS